MTINHFDPSELDRVDPELDRLAEGLEAYAADLSPTPPAGLTSRIVQADSTKSLSKLATRCSPSRRMTAKLVRSTIEKS